MRIIHLSYSIPTPVITDPEAWLRRINFSIGVLENMAKFEEIIGIYHIQYKGILEKNGVLYHFPGYNKWRLLFPLQFNRYVKNLSPDVVIVHGLIFPWQVVMLRFQLGKHVKLIAQHHAERPLRDVRQYFQRWADWYISAYMFCAKDLARQWIDAGQIKDESKIKEVMEVSSSFYTVDKALAQSKTKISGGTNFLWVGRLHPIKDPLLAVRAFIRFAKFKSNVKLYLIYQSTELLTDVINLVNKAGAQNSIILVGKVEHADLLYWYNSADFIISSSHYEGSGTAVCEAMSCGCIPILTNIPSFRMMTAGGFAGLLYEVGHEEALLDALQKSLELDQKEMRDRVLGQFKSTLSFEAIARKTMDIIHETA